MSGTLRGHERKEYEPNCSVHKEPAEGRSTRRAIDDESDGLVYDRQVTA